MRHHGCRGRLSVQLSFFLLLACVSWLVCPGLCVQHVYTLSNTPITACVARGRTSLRPPQRWVLHVFCEGAAVVCFVLCRCVARWGDGNAGKRVSRAGAGEVQTGCGRSACAYGTPQKNFSLLTPSFAAHIFLKFAVASLCCPMITMQPLAGASASSVATRSPTSMHLLFPLSSFRPLPRSEVGVPVSCVPVAASRCVENAHAFIDAYIKARVTRTRFPLPLRRRQQPPRIRCQAASTAPSTLSSRFGTGTLPGGAIPFRLLQDALPTLVRSLSQAPLLLLTSAPGMEKIVSIPRTVDASDDKVC